MATKITTYDDPCISYAIFAVNGHDPAAMEKFAPCTKPRICPDGSECADLFIKICLNPEIKHEVYKNIEKTIQSVRPWDQSWVAFTLQAIIVCLYPAESK